ncbi:peptidase M13 [Actinomycetaceae bacterium TAE3-ERU4]|nr:peptidase M13 [Actinomycetaceae bacterium TAE3-ERU4]
MRNIKEDTLLSGSDSNVRPQDDLFAFVNGNWIKEFEIPADRPIHGSFYDLRDSSERDVHEIIKECASGKIADTDAKRIGRYYSAFMDEESVEQLGASPLVPLFAEIDEKTSHTQLAELMGKHQYNGMRGLFSFYVSIDRNSPNRYVPYVSQSGISLPDESYYREDHYQEIRESYLKHIERMFTLVEENINSVHAAQVIFELETKIAKLHWDKVSNRDAKKTNNPMTFSELKESANGFAWDSWYNGLSCPTTFFSEVIVYQPSFFTEVSLLWKETKLDTLKLWLKWQTIQAFASELDSRIVNENFDFWGRTLTGSEVIRERWKRGVAHVEGALGEALGRLYVERHFPPENKARMQTLVANLLEAYRQSISNLEWMSPQTRKRALEKLASFNPKIAYPNEWRSYEGLSLDGDNLVEIACEVARFESDYEYAKVGSPLNPEEWHMTPQTVNAYYNPTANEIVFPAAILRPPFFSPDRPDVLNYAAIGAVIGHEIGHGFDDQGSQYDGNGAMNNWWTDTDREEFEKRTKRLIDQYDGFTPSGLDSTYHVNGALTIGENIGDLGGLGIAWKAWKLSLAEKGITDVADAPKVGDIPAAKAFFYSWARCWRSKVRPAFAIQLLSIDPHSPNEFRCNGIVSNMDAFAEVFDLKETDALWLDPENRVTIW